MKKYIEINPQVRGKTPAAFKKLINNKLYKLTKIASKRASMVGVGYTVTGLIRIVDNGGPGLVIEGERYSDSITTSPIKNTLVSNDKVIIFETDGGFYSLEILDDNQAKAV